MKMIRMKQFYVLIFILCSFTKSYSNTIVSNAVTGNWNAAATWAGGVVPTASDDVIIANGATVTITAAASCASLTVGQGVSGVLQFVTTASTTLTVAGNTTIASGASLLSSGSNPGAVRTHTMSVGGDLSNNGILNCLAFANSKINITFTGAASNAFTTAVAATTTFNLITLNKGTSNTNILDFNPSSTVSLPAAGALTITNGTFELDGAVTISNPVFSAAAYTIPATGGFWLNNSNATVTAQAGNATLTGLLRISAGTYNFGTLATHIMTGAAATSSLLMEGGTLNVSARLQLTGAASSFSQSGGAINVATVGNSTSNSASFLAAGLFTMSAGTIVLQKGSTGAIKSDYNVTSSAVNINITGGSVQAGGALTAAASIFRMAGSSPNIFLDNSSGNNPGISTIASLTVYGDINLDGSGTFTKGNFPLTMQGMSVADPGNIIVNGTNALTLTSGITAANALIFSGSFDNQSITLNSGSITSSQTGAVTVSNTSAGGIVTIPAGLSVLDGAALSLTKGILSAGSISFGSGGATGVNCIVSDGVMTTIPNVNTTGLIAYTYTNGNSISNFTTGLELLPAVTLPTTSSITINRQNATDIVNIPATVTATTLTVSNGVLPLPSGATLTVTGNASIGASGTINISGGVLNVNGNTSTVAGSSNFIMSAGTFNAGTAPNNSVAFANGSNIQISGGTIVVAGKFGVAAAANNINYNQIGGIIYTATLGGSNSVSLASFDAGTSASTNFTMTGGQIIVCQGQLSFPGSNPDFRGPALTVPAANLNFTGTGIVQLGTAAIASLSIAGTAASTTFRYYQNTPNFILDGTNNPVLASAGNIVVNGDMTLNGTGNYHYMTHSLTLKGSSAAFPGNYFSNITFSPGPSATLNFTSSFGSQHFNAGSFNSIGNMIVNNTFPGSKIFFGAGINPIVTGTLTLTSGIVSNPLDFYIGLSAPASLVGGSSASYIEGRVVRVFAASRTATGTFDQTTVIPCGKNGVYLPIYLDPSTNSGGTVQLRVEAFTSNPGTNIVPANFLSASNWTATVLVGPANLTNVFMQVNDAPILSNYSILKSIVNGSTYIGITPACIYNPGTLSSATALMAAEFIANTAYAYGKYCALSTLNGPGKMCTGAVSQFVNMSNANTPYTGTWSSTATGVATVDASGNATGVSAGSTSIKLVIASGDGCDGIIVTKPISVTSCSAAPGGIKNNLVSWYEGNAGLTTGSWADQTSANALTASGAPVVNSHFLNYNPVATFNGSTDAYGNAGASGWLGSVNGSTYYYVASSAAGGGNVQQMVYGRGSANGVNTSANGGRYNTSIFASGDIMAQPYVVNPTWTDHPTMLSRAGFNGSVAGAYYVNANAGAEVAGSTATPVITGTAPFYIGRAATAGSFWQGDIAEVISFNKKQTSADYNKIESYLALKYGITLDNSAGGNAGDYTLSNGATAWTASVDPVYHRDIIALARDDASGLLQKQSRTADDSLRVFMGNLSANNAANGASIINNLSAITIGNDGGRLRGSQTLPMPATIFARFERTWKVTNTNFNGNFGIEIMWDSMGPFNLGDIRLLISDSPDFTNATSYDNSIVDFYIGSIIVKKISSTMIPAGTTKYFTIGSANLMTPLGVHLALFTATSFNNEWVKLDWQATAENSNESFTIERSKTGNNWETVTRVAGNGDATTLQAYSSIDKNPYSGTSYYRLKQTDATGKYGYSATRMVVIGNTKNTLLNMYPNPASNLLTLDGSAEELKTFRLLNVGGQDVTGMVKTVKNSGTILVLDVSKLPPGVYGVKTATTVSKLLKQ